jgi:hypothetical protein
MKWNAHLDEIADMICGNGEGAPFVYRSSSYIRGSFRQIRLRPRRVHAPPGIRCAEQFRTSADAQTPPTTFCQIIATLMDVGDFISDRAACCPLN